MTANVFENNPAVTGPADIAVHPIDDFCHDVRGPLTVIKEFASIIGDGLGGPVSSKQKEYVDTIIRAADEAAGMVDELLQQHATPKEQSCGQ